MDVVEKQCQHLKQVFNNASVQVKRRRQNKQLVGLEIRTTKKRGGQWCKHEENKTTTINRTKGITLNFLDSDDDTLILLL